MANKQLTDIPTDKEQRERENYLREWPNAFWPKPNARSDCDTKQHQHPRRRRRWKQQLLLQENQHGYATRIDDKVWTVTNQ